MGLPDSEFAYQDLKSALSQLHARAKQVAEVGDSVRNELGGEYSVRQAEHVLRCFIAASEHTAKLLQRQSDKGGALGSIAAGWQAQLQDATRIHSYASAAGLAQRTLTEVLEGSRAHLDAIRQLEDVAVDKAFLELFEPALNGVTTDEAGIAQCIQRADAVSAISGSLPSGTVNRLLDVGTSAMAHALREALASFVEAFAAYKDSMADLGRWGALDWAVWGGSPFASDAVARLELAREGGASLIPWSKYLSAKSDAADAGLRELVARIERGTFSPRKRYRPSSTFTSEAFLVKS